MTMLAETIAALIERIAARLLAGRRSCWLEAMAAERAALEGGALARLMWAASCLRAALRVRAGDCDAGYLALLLAGASGVIACDWLGESDRETVALLVAAAATAAFLRPRRQALAVAWLGSCLLLAHGFSDRTGLWLPPYQFEPLRAWEWLLIASVALPAFVAARFGAALRRAISRLHAAS